MEANLWSKKDLEELLRELIRESLPAGISFYQVKFEFYVDSNLAFEYAAKDNRLKIITSDEKVAKNIIDSLDRSGLLEIDSTFMFVSTPDFAHKSTNFHDWADWFMQFVSLCSFVVVDTNIIINHYFSNLVFSKLKDRIKNIGIRIPRLTILEIERLANSGKDEEKKKFEKDVQKRLALSATTEVMFLKSHGSELLPPIDTSLLTSFTEKAGSKNVDAWIRKEVHDYVRNTPTNSLQSNPLEPLFVTCDIVNGLAAYSEGLNTLLFSKLQYDNFSIPTSFSDASSLAEAILNIAITFGKIEMKVYPEGKTLKHCIEIEGMWSGKTPYQWAKGSPD